MTVEQFFNLFLIEVKSNHKLWNYYKFFSGDGHFVFRKAYFCQRLQYVADNIGPDKQQRIWDCGCGFGTTALFLAMNGYTVFGSTLEFYFDQIEERKKYWSAHGSANLFTCRYENLFDLSYKQCFDTIILQDTLHHLEPITEALRLLHQAMPAKGRLLVLEENGSNIVQNIKLMGQRGFRKKIILYDERLQKNILLGNENIRSIKKWRAVLNNANMLIANNSLQYIRFFLPFCIKKKSFTGLVAREQQLVRSYPWLSTYFYFGINFIAFKK